VTIDSRLDASDLWRQVAALRRLTYNKLVLFNAAESINDLRVPPGNRLEKLSGNRAGQYSIRVNDQWRVELVDDH
jgi:plasmid maintenance system killer protein